MSRGGDRTKEEPIKWCLKESNIRTVWLIKYRGPKGKYKIVSVKKLLVKKYQSEQKGK